MRSDARHLFRHSRQATTEDTIRFVTDITWTDKLPAKDLVKSEVQAMINAVRGALLEELGEARIRGIYHKGSGNRQWISALDYVPEISDVDIHLWFHNDREVERLRDIATALKIQGAIENRYLASVQEPIHMPRPQLIILNELKRRENYIPSPLSSVDTIFGEDYPDEHDKSDAEIREIDAEQMKT